MEMHQAADVASRISELRILSVGGSSILVLTGLPVSSSVNEVMTRLSVAGPLSQWLTYVLIHEGHEVPAACKLSEVTDCRETVVFQALVQPTMCPIGLEDNVICWLEFASPKEVIDKTGNTVPRFLGSACFNTEDGNGAVFKHHGDMVELQGDRPGGLDMAGGWTISVWILREKICNGRWQTIACSHGDTNNNFLMLQDGVFVSYPFTAGFHCSSSDVPVSDLHAGYQHIVEDGGNVQLYVNGEARGIPFEKLGPGLGLQYVGGSHRFGDAPFGVLDRFVVFNMALSDAQVDDLFQIQRRLYMFPKSFSEFPD